MDHFVAYHSAKKMGRTLEQDGDLNHLSRKLGLLKKAIGNTVWVIQGLPTERRTEYLLCGAYIADALHELPEEPGLYCIEGSSGIDFTPSILLNDFPWFPALLKAQSNFSLGFNHINDRAAVEALLALRAEQAHSPLTGELQDDDLELSAMEGAPLLVTHLRRERSRQLVENKKAAALEAMGSLICEVCGFDFARVYGDWGEGFCEVHHKIPIAAAEASRFTRLEDLAILCSNCHRVIHRVDPMPSVEDLSLRVRNSS